MLITCESDFGDDGKGWKKGEWMNGETPVLLHDKTPNCNILLLTANNKYKIAKIFVNKNKNQM